MEKTDKTNWDTALLAASAAAAEESNKRHRKRQARGPIDAEKVATAVDPRRDMDAMVAKYNILEKRPTLREFARLLLAAGDKLELDAVLFVPITTIANGYENLGAWIRATLTPQGMGSAELGPLRCRTVDFFIGPHDLVGQYAGCHALVVSVTATLEDEELAETCRMLITGMAVEDGRKARKEAGS